MMNLTQTNSFLKGINCKVRVKRENPESVAVFDGGEQIGTIRQRNDIYDIFDRKDSHAFSILCSLTRVMNG